MSDEGINDAALDAATNRIVGMLGKGGMNSLEERLPGNENQTNRDLTRRERSGDMDDDDVSLSADEEKNMDPRTARSGQQPAEKAEDGQDKKEDAAAASEDWLEIPAAEEGAEPERVPLNEAVEAIKQVRAMQGDIAAAVHKAEDEARANQAKYLEDVVRMHTTVRQQAEMALQTIPTPQPPSRAYLDPNSQHYNPEYYHRAMLEYEDQARAWQGIEQRAMQARQQQQAALDAASEAAATREHERLSRYLPDWKDEGKRATMINDLTEKLGKTYGITPEFINAVPFNHGLVRMAMDALAAKEAPPAPKPAEVRKAVQERVAKVVKGNAQPRNSDGTFQAGQASQAREALRKSGDERDAARLFMSDPSLRQLLK